MRALLVLCAMIASVKGQAMWVSRGAVRVDAVGCLAGCALKAEVHRTWTIPAADVGWEFARIAWDGETASLFAVGTGGRNTSIAFDFMRLERVAGWDERLTE